MAQAGVKILGATTGDADIAGGGLTIVVPKLPRNARILYYFSPGRAIDAVLRHTVAATEGLLISANVGDPDDFQSGPWYAHSAPKVVTSAGPLTLTVTVVLVEERGQ